MMASAASPGEQQPFGLGSPVTPGARIALLDILRGLALFGILLVNFNTDYFSPPASAADRAAHLAIEFFCEGSFFPIFAFLFGLGFALQVTRLEDRGAPVVRIYLRRLAALFGIGLANAVFLSHGEILRRYAVVAVPLLLVRRFSSRTLVVLVALCLLLTVKYDVVTSLAQRSPALQRWIGAVAESNAVQSLRPAERRAVEGRSYGQLVRVRARIAWEELRRFPLASTHPQIFAMFLLGMLAARGGLLWRPLEHRALLRYLMGGGLVLGLAGNFIAVLGPTLAAQGFELIPRRVLDFDGPIGLIGDLALGMFYLTGVTLLLSRREVWQRRLSPLGQVGRMALTNYLLQSAAMLVLMAGFGLGLGFTLGLAASIPLKLALFAGQIALSQWWMGRFRFGPAEWFWRVATYSGIRGTPVPRVA